MSPQLVAILARIAACNARIEAMKACNTHRLNIGLGIAYDEDSFMHEANNLDQLSTDAINLLN